MLLLRPAPMHAGDPDAWVLEHATETRTDRELTLHVPPVGAVDAWPRLARAMAARPAFVLLADAVGLVDVEQLGARLAVAEAEADLPDGGTRVLAAVTDSAAGVRALPSFRRTRRLAGLVCDPSRLRAELGCAPDAAAVLAAVAETVLAASACGVPALLAVATDDAVTRAAARDQGFAGLALRRPAGLRPGSDGSG